MTNYFFSTLNNGIDYLNESVYNLNKSSNKNHLGSYLAGLIEGDGYILVRKEKGEKVSPAIILTFHEKEMAMFIKLKNILGYGNIYKEKSGVCRFQITSEKDMINTINLINGYFRTPKIEALHRAIDNLNKWRKANLCKSRLDNSDFFSNAWLAGFTDADGWFYLNLTGHYAKDGFTKNRSRIQCRFALSQREIYKRTNESFVNIMSELSKYFKCNLNYKLASHPSFKEPAKLLVFYLQSNKKHHLVINFFNKYPLMSSKYLNYLDYCKALSFLSRPLTYEEILNIRNIKNSMNNKRTYFNWDHLNNNIYSN